MPRIIEHRCNMTLTRNEWSVLVALLDRVRIFHPSIGGVPSAAIAAIQKALRDEPEAASVSIDKETDKWASVIQAVHDEACKRGGEYGKVLDKMTRQWSAAEFTPEF